MDKSLRPATFGSRVDNSRLACRARSRATLPLPPHPADPPCLARLSCLLVRFRRSSSARCCAFSPSTFPPPKGDADEIDYANDVAPILSRYGCNSGGCHGKASGQYGFKLSLFGFDNQYDREAIASQARGRRVFAGAPEQSLLLTKAIGQTPHGGGKRFDVDSPGISDVLLIGSGPVVRRRSAAPRCCADLPRTM